MPFRFETLESRLLLTATATAKGKTLVITGDGNADDVLVFTDGTGNVRVDLDNDGNVDEEFTGIKNIKISLGGGANELTLGGDANELEITGKLTVKGGLDVDNVNLGATRFEGKKVSFDLGKGVDGVFGDNTIFNCDLNIKMGDGSDVVLLGSNLDVAFNGKLNINMGDDSDEMVLRGLPFGGKAKANGGAGEDFFSVSNNFPGKLKNFETEQV